MTTDRAPTIRQMAEQVIREHDEFCIGHFVADEPWCSAAPEGRPLCLNCAKFADAIEAFGQAVAARERERCGEQMRFSGTVFVIPPNRPTVVEDASGIHEVTNTIPPVVTPKEWKGQALTTSNSERIMTDTPTTMRVYQFLVEVHIDPTNSKAPSIEALECRIGDGPQYLDGVMKVTADYLYQYDEIPDDPDS